MSGFPNTLRVRPGILSVTPNGAPAVWTLRVQAADAWDAVRVECTPDTTVRAMKQAAMADPVSYTHLDVYKRQLVHRLEVRPLSPKRPRPGA